jgi:hypothetical protein
MIRPQQAKNLMMEAYIGPVNDLLQPLDAASDFDAITSHLMALSRYFVDVLRTGAYRLSE